MKNIWFKKAGWLYRPVTTAGGVVTIVLALFCVHIVLVANARAHSVSDLIYGVFPYLVPTFLVWIWITGNTSKD